MPKLENKVALITGSDSGIGQATAEEFARAGADVAVTFHTDEEGAQDTAERVKAVGRRVIVRQLDVRDEASVAAVFDAAAAELGVLDILVNNAGVGAGGTSVADMTTEEFDRVIKTDLYGPFFCSREFIRRRKAAGNGGKIINITSVHEAIPSPGSASYGAAKGGLLTFIRPLALELASAAHQRERDRARTDPHAHDGEADRRSGKDEEGATSDSVEPDRRALGNRAASALSRF
jgi:glucose 1-dehydrogenase